MKQNCRKINSPTTGRWQVHVSLVCVLAMGCSLHRPPAPAALLPGPAAPVVAAPAAPQPMTLPQYLGINAVLRGVGLAAHRTRLRLSTRWPVLQPSPHNPPIAMADPANLMSPAPAVAAAAAIQQAEADAPAKVQALSFLATANCSQNPQIEEALLAGMDDLSADVRAAAAQAIIDSQRSCQACAKSCNHCCTAAIRAKLTCLAYQQDAEGCYVEPSSKIRRVARLALCNCGGPVPVESSTPMESPPAELVELLQQTSGQP